jgi:hypothetical protein
METMVQPKFYLYEISYLDPSSEETVPIYVGCGSGRRAWTHRYRSHNRMLAGFVEWCRGEGQELRIDILERFATMEEAYSAERDLISAIGRGDRRIGPLYNVSDGGKGLSGWGTAERRVERGASGLSYEDRLKGAKATNALVTRETRSRAGRARARHTNSRRVECPGCGLVTTRGPMATHRRACTAPGTAARGRAAS